MTVDLMFGIILGVVLSVGIVLFVQMLEDIDLE